MREDIGQIFAITSSLWIFTWALLAMCSSHANRVHFGVVSTGNPMSFFSSRGISTAQVLQKSIWSRLSFPSLQLTGKVLFFYLDDMLPRHDNKAQISVRHLHLDGRRRGVGVVLGGAGALLDRGLSVLVGVGQDDVAVLLARMRH